MSELVKSYRNTTAVETLNDTILMQPSPFRPSHLSYIMKLDPVALLEHAQEVPGYKKLPIGSILEKYRFDKIALNSYRNPADMPSMGFNGESEKDLKLFDADFVRYSILR